MKNSKALSLDKHKVLSMVKNAAISLHAVREGFFAEPLLNEWRDSSFLPVAEKGRDRPLRVTKEKRSFRGSRFDRRRMPWKGIQFRWNPRKSAAGIITLADIGHFSGILPGDYITSTISCNYSLSLI